jgi:phenylpyruvate tautomerase PptA (4-oxalocrotonate tautomerase family)
VLAQEEIMPLVKISIRKGRTDKEKKAILDGIHMALVEAFEIPDSDRVQRIDEYNENEFEIPNDRTDKFTIIEITVLPGRSFEAKKKLYKLIFNQLKTLGYNANDAVVVLHEPEINNWGVRGGLPAGEIDLGFNLKV